MKTISYFKLNVITSMFFVILMSSCSIQRHSHKNIATTDVKKEVDSTSNRTISNITQTKLVEIITERADTGVVIPAWSVRGSVKDGTIALKGGGFITFIKDHSDSFKIVMPTKAVAFHYDKRTVRTAEIKNKIITKAQGHVRKKEREKLRTKAVDRIANFSMKVPWWIWGISFLLVIGGGWYAFRRL